MLKVGECELPGVVGEVDGVHVPGDLLSVGHVVVVAVAGVLRGEATTGPHVFEVQGLHLPHRLDPLDRNNLHLQTDSA